MAGRATPALRIGGTTGQRLRWHDSYRHRFEEVANRGKMNFYGKVLIPVLRRNWQHSEHLLS